MKAIIKFKLPEDDQEFAIHNMANNMACLLWELTHNTKRKCERQIDSDLAGGLNLNVYNGADLVFEKIEELLIEYNINVDKLG